MTANEHPIFTDKPFEPFAKPIDSCYVESLNFESAKVDYDTAKTNYERTAEALRQAKVGIWGAIGLMLKNTPVHDLPTTLDEAIDQVEESLAAQNSNDQTWRTANDNLKTVEKN